MKNNLNGTMLFNRSFHVQKAITWYDYTDSDAPNAITVANVDKEKYPEPFFSSDLLNKNDLELVDGQAPTWWNYFLCGVKGVVGELLENTKQHQNENGEQKICGYIALMDGKIPPSAGLSSSSAVVVSAAVCK